MCVCVWYPSRVLLETCSGLVIKQQNVTCECSMSNPRAVPAGLVPTAKFQIPVCVCFTLVRPGPT